MTGCSNFLESPWKVIYITAVLCILPMAVLVAAGCLSSSENDMGTVLPTAISPVPTVTMLISPNDSGVLDKNASLPTMLPYISTTVTQNPNQYSPIQQTTTIKPSTIVRTTTIKVSDSTLHFYIVDFDAESVTVPQNKSFTVFVNMKAFNWDYQAGCAGYNCRDNLDTIPIKLNILGYPDKKIQFNSFGLGGDKKGSADFHVGYWISDLPVGKYTLEFSTPDSVVRKDLNVI